MGEIYFGEPSDSVITYADKRINGKILAETTSACYTVCETKRATMPQLSARTPQNLSSTIATIPSEYVSGDIGTPGVPKNVTGNIWGNVEGSISGDITKDPGTVMWPAIQGNITNNIGLPAIHGDVMGGSDEHPAIRGSVLNHDPSNTAIESNSSSYPTVGGNIVNMGGLPAVQGYIMGGNSESTPVIDGYIMTQSPDSIAIVTSSTYPTIEGKIKNEGPAPAIMGDVTAASAPAIIGNIQTMGAMPAIQGDIMGGGENIPAVAGSILHNDPSYNAIESGSSSYPTVGGNIVNMGGLPAVQGNIQGGGDMSPALIGSVLAPSPSQVAIGTSSGSFPAVSGRIENNGGIPAVHGDIFGGGEYAPAIDGTIYCGSPYGTAITGDVYGKIMGTVYLHSVEGSNVTIDTNPEDAVLKVFIGDTIYGIHVN